MSDYLTRLVQRSLGSAPMIAPMIAPLIAPIHAPSDQALSERELPPVERSQGEAIDAPSDQAPGERTETSVAFEPDRSTATTRASPRDAPPGGPAGRVEPAPLHTEGQPPRLSSPPLHAGQAEFPIQKKGDRAQLAESRPQAPAQQTSSTPRAEPMVTAAASPPYLPALPSATPTSSKEAAETAVQPEIVNPLKPAAPLPSRIIRPFKPAAAPVVPETPPEEPPGFPLPTTVTPERTSQTIVQPEIRNHPKPAAPPPLPALESLAVEPPSMPSTTSTAPARTTQVVVQPETMSPLKPVASPLLSARQPSPNEPPAIHVTIGRVEVRAVMPHPRTPKVESPAPPRLSLEDYLKQRNGGARE